MDKFSEVAKDIITSIDKLEYTDVEKKLICTDIMYNLYTMLENKEKYDSDIKVLQEHQSNEKKKSLKL